MHLKHLTDHQLLIDTNNLVGNERVMIVDLLEHLIEIENRKLFSDLKYKSMHDFVTRHLKYSDQSAARRIKASQLLREIPEIASKINSRSLDLTILHKAAIFFKKQNVFVTSEKAKILSLLEDKSSLECDKILLELNPKPLPTESVRAISQDFMQLKINIADETHRKLEEVKSLMGFHLIDNNFFSKIADEAYENIMRKRFRLTDHGGVSVSRPGKMPSNFERRTAFENAVEKACAICGGCFYLQEDHIIPRALGGTNDPSNLRLLCFNCNQRQRIKARL